MMRLFLPFILIILGIGLFVAYTNPTYQNIKSLAAQTASYDTALNEAQKLHKMRDDLIAQRNNIPSQDLDKLQRILPDNVDSIRFIIDINSIASRHNLALTNVDLGNLSPGPAAQTGTSAGSTASGTDMGNPIGSVDIGFSVSTANYNDFLAFVQDLEHSLRLIDISKINIATGQAGGLTYTMSVRTYWLHKS